MRHRPPPYWTARRSSSRGRPQSASSSRRTRTARGRAPPAAGPCGEGWRLVSRVRSRRLGGLLRRPPAPPGRLLSSNAAQHAHAPVQGAVEEQRHAGAEEEDKGEVHPGEAPQEAAGWGDDVERALQHGTGAGPGGGVVRERPGGGGERSRACSRASYPALFGTDASPAPRRRSGTAG